MSERAQIQAVDEAVVSAPPSSALITSNVALQSMKFSKLRTIENLEETDTNLQKVLKYKKLSFSILIAAVIMLVVNVGLIMLVTYFQYRDVIQLVDKYSGQIGSPGGFATAVAIKFPVLATAMGFVSPAYPQAVFQCVRNPDINPAFVAQGEQQVLLQMWQNALVGGPGCPNVDGDLGIPTAAALICCAITTVNLNICLGACDVSQGGSTLDYAQSITSSTVTWGMVGAQFFPPFGAMIGAAVGAAIGATTTYLNSKYNPQPPCIS